MSAMDPLIIKIEYQGRACPYEAEGVFVVKGVEYPFYFRYRGDRAQIYVWEPGYACEFFDKEHLLFWRQQTNVTGIPHNGYMEDAEAVGHINRWAEEFQGEMHDRLGNGARPATDAHGTSNGRAPEGA